jgi:threonyl-tRNA synthetase
MAVVGMKEMETNQLAVRSRKLGDLGSFGVEDLIAELSRCSDIAEEMSLIGEKEAKPEIAEETNTE